MALRPAGTRSKRRRNYPGEDDEEFRLSGPKQRRTAAAQSSPAQRAATSFEPLPSAIQQALLEQTTSTAAFPTTTTARPQYHAHFPPHLASARHSSVASSRDRTPPHAGKRCETCGVTSTPQWRRGPSGKRTLCNACGVKWSFGRLNPSSGSAGAGSGGAKSHTTGDEYDTMTDSDDMEAYTPEVSAQTTRPSPGTPTPGGTGTRSGTNSNANAKVIGGLETEVKTLKRKLKDSEKSRKRLRKIIDDTVNDTAVAYVDPRYRRVLANAQQQAAIVASGGDPTSTTAPTSILDNPALIYPRYEPISLRAQQRSIAKQMIQAHTRGVPLDNEDSSDDEDEDSPQRDTFNHDVVNDDEDEEEEAAKQELVVLGFILSVKERNKRWEAELRRMRVPHAQPGCRDPIMV